MKATIYDGIPIETYHIKSRVNGSPELQICKVDEQCYVLWWKDGHRCFLEGCRYYDSVEEAERAIRSHYGWFADKTNEAKKEFLKETQKEHENEDN